MSGATRCYDCGHGRLDGFTLAWDRAGRLRHEPENDDVWDCVENVGVVPGFGRCGLGEHAVPRDQLYLAEAVYAMTDGRLPSEGVVAPRRAGHAPPHHLRFGREAWPEYGTLVIDEDAADWPFGDDIPAGTKGIIFEVSDGKGTPFAACRACVDANIDYGSDVGRLWQKAKDRPGWRKVTQQDAPRASGGRTSRATASGSPDPSEGRLSALRAALAEPASTAVLAGKLGVDQRTVQRLLKDVGATSSRAGKSILWSLPKDDAPATTDDSDDTGDSDVAPVAVEDDER